MAREGAGPWPLSFLRLARPRTWYFAASMWAVAYLSTGAWRWPLLLAGIVICMLMTGATNLINAITDRREDRHNLPQRTLLIEHVGLPRLRVLTAACYVVPLLLSLALTPLVHTAVCLAGAAVSVSYSWGLRLKARPVSSLASLSTVVVFPFLAGWSMARPLGDVSPLVLVFGISFFAYANMKNLPDESGDRAAGVRTLFTVLSRGRGERLLLALLLIPYLVLAGLIAAGRVEPRLLLLLGFLPVPFLLVLDVRRSRTVAEKERVHAWAYLYQMVFLTAGLLLYEPTLIAALVLATLASCSLTFESLGVDSRPQGLAPLRH